MRTSSPGRIPVPTVLSSGVKPSGTGWYSDTLPDATLSLRSTRTSRADRGYMLPVSVSSPQALRGTGPANASRAWEVTPGSPAVGSDRPECYAETRPARHIRSAYQGRPEAVLSISPAHRTAPHPPAPTAALFGGVK